MKSINLKNRRFLTGLLLVALFMTMSLGPAFGEVGSEGKEVALPDIAGEAYEDAVMALMEKEIITGSTDGNFHPDSELNRAQVCVMVVKAAGLPLSEGPTGFKDMSGYGWADTYVKTAYEYGIVNGYGGGLFKPGASVSSDELVTFVLRAGGFTDESLKGEWPQNYIEKGQEKGLYEKQPEEMPKTALKWMAAQMIYDGLPMIEKAELEKLRDLEETLPDLVEDGSIAITDMNFKGPTIEMSLEDAIKRMKTTGPAFEIAVMTRDALLSGSKSSSGQLDELAELKRQVDIQYSIDPSSQVYQALKAQLDGVTSQDKKILELTEDYLWDQAPIQYEIALNNMEADGAEIYFACLQAKENLRISKENLEIKKTKVNTVKKRYNLGVASRMEVRLAEGELLEAENMVNEANSFYAQARMGYNLQMNYPLMQDVKLTDSLKKNPLPDISLEKAIASALKERNEIPAAKYDLDVSTIKFNSVKAYPKTSGTYLGAQADYMGKKLAYDQTIKGIEMEVRTKYMDLINLSKAVDIAKINADTAKEALRIANISYNAGLNTLIDVNSAETTSYLAQLGLSKATTDLNQAIFQFKFAIGKGTGKTGGQ